MSRQELAPPRLGAHMSTAGGLPSAVQRALDVDATALQVFVKSSRQWSARPLDPSQVEAFRADAERSGLARYTLAHASYLINLASPDPALWKRSIDAFGVELERCAILGIPYLVVHPGSHVGSGEAAGLSRVARALAKLLRGAGGRANEAVTVLLEITAGQGTNLGYRFEQLARIIEESAVDERLGVCFDTCHALAAGYDFRDRRSYRETFDQLEGTIGIDKLLAFHLNDSKHGLGSRRDRHEHIGRGEVGLEAFRLLLADPRFRDLPMVLETPKGEDLAEDRKNLSTLRSLLKRQAKVQTATRTTRRTGTSRR